MNNLSGYNTDGIRNYILMGLIGFSLIGGCEYLCLSEKESLKESRSQLKEVIGKTLNWIGECPSSRDN